MQKEQTKQKLSSKQGNDEKMLREDQKTYYFMSGLPRSGSTVLCAILNQNPRIYSGPNSPVITLMRSIESIVSNDEAFKAYPKPKQAKKLISSVISNYYSDVEKPVVIDKNRSWPYNLNYVSEYLGIEAKLICPVRSINEILSSFISMHRRNPFQVDGIVNFIDRDLIYSNIALTDDERCDYLAGPNGIVGQSYSNLEHALLTGHEKQLHFVEYEDLINSPEETLKSIYNFLGEEYYEHDFKNIIDVTPGKDAKAFGISDIHHVRKELSKKSIKPSEILSENILKKYADVEFWRSWKTL